MPESFVFDISTMTTVQAYMIDAYRIKFSYSNNYFSLTHTREMPTARVRVFRMEETRNKLLNVILRVIFKLF